MKKIIFAALFFLAAAPLLLFQETGDVFENNQKFLRGGLNQWVSGSVGQWVSSMIGKRSYEFLIMMPRPHPETNENQHKRFAQHIGSPRRGAPGRRRQIPRLYFALAVSYHVKSDQYFKQVYGNGTANYTAEAGYRLIRNLAVGIKLSYLHKKGKTLLLQSETSLRQIPVMGYLKAGFGLGRGWQGYGALGFGYLFFKEESYIGTIEDSHPGWGLESGLEYSFTRNLYFLWAVGFQSFKKTFSGLNETQQLGGVDIRVGIGIRVF
jgi:hypothetical protein